MTPAVIAARKAGIKHSVHEYQHDPACTNYGEEAAAALGLNPEQIFKTLLVSLNGDTRKLAVAIVPVATMLDLKAVAKALKVKKAEMADPAIAEKTTGYVVGGISPLGQKKRLPAIIDQSASQLPTINVSGGRRGLEIELAPVDLARMNGGIFAPISRS